MSTDLEARFDDAMMDVYRRALNECDFVTRISRTNGTQIVRTKWPRLSTRSAAQFTAFVDKAARSSAPTPTLTAMA